MLTNFLYHSSDKLTLAPTSIVCRILKSKWLPFPGSSGDSLSIRMAMRHLVHIKLLFLLSHIFNRVFSEHCIKGEESINGWKLQGHIYKTMIANFGYECLLTCRQDKRCQSFNWVISLDMCEFSNRTKEARPEDFVPDPDRYYYRRHMNRGKMN